jgi:hypothetical protein
LNTTSRFNGNTKSIIRGFGCAKVKNKIDGCLTFPSVKKSPTQPMFGGCRMKGSPQEISEQKKFQPWVV